MERMKPSPAERMPQVLLAAATGRSLTGLDVILQGVAPEELCHPLTKEQLAQIRTCTSFTRQEVQAVQLPHAGDTGLQVFRVHYDIAGCDADGNAVSVTEDGAVGLACGGIGDGFFRHMLAISDVECCRLNDDGSVQRPGWLERRLRRWLRRKRRQGIGETVGEGLLEALGAVLEVVLEAVFDG